MFSCGSALSLVLRPQVLDVGSLVPGLRRGTYRRADPRPCPCLDPHPCPRLRPGLWPGPLPVSPLALGLVHHGIRMLVTA
jgi:hypothetical protein